MVLLGHCRSGRFTGGNLLYFVDGSWSLEHSSLGQCLVSRGTGEVRKSCLILRLTSAWWKGMRGRGRARVCNDEVAFGRLVGGEGV